MYSLIACHWTLNTPKKIESLKKNSQRQNSNSNLLISSKTPRNRSNWFSATWYLMNCTQQVRALARDVCHGKQRVSQFYHISQLAYPEDFDFRNFSHPGFLMLKMTIGLINIGSSRSFINRSWQSHWGDVTFNSILSFSSLSITYCRLWRRAWRRCWTMTLLSWKCPWCWRARSWRRIWQAWNHNRNEVLRVAGNPNPVFNETWFLTIDPFIRIPVFIAKLSER